jgi:hypothetical protein
VGWTRLADGLERGGEFAAPEGRAVPVVLDALVPETLVPETLVPETLVPETLVPETLACAEALARAEFSGLDRGWDRRLEAAVPGGWWPGGASGPAAGLNVATDSMAPATRQTARMLASRGITVPCPANGRVSLRSRLRRRLARSSRW